MNGWTFGAFELNYGLVLFLSWKENKREFISDSKLKKKNTHQADFSNESLHVIWCSPFLVAFMIRQHSTQTCNKLLRLWGLLSIIWWGLSAEKEQLGPTGYSAVGGRCGGEILRLNRLHKRQVFPLVAVSLHRPAIVTNDYLRTDVIKKYSPATLNVWYHVMCLCSGERNDKKGDWL